MLSELARPAYSRAAIEHILASRPASANTLEASRSPNSADYLSSRPSGAL